MLKLSMSTGITIILITFFVVSIAATAQYYSIPRPTYLRILHTHPDEMIDEIVKDFEEWYQEQYGHPIMVTAIQTDPQTAFEKATSIFRTAEAEIWWGGPLSLFQDAYDRLLPYNSTYKNNIDVTNSYPLMDTSEKTPRWYAASLYGLGVMYNEHRLQELDLSTPQTWKDLADYKWQGNITMVDPAESEFTAPLITLTLQSQGWTSGWEYLVTLPTLIEEYETKEHDSALKVSSDYLPLAVVSDFYAYERMAGDIPQVKLTYLDVTILQPDPIAILDRGTYIDEAKALIDYILTLQTQNILGQYLLPIHPEATPPSEPGPFDPNFPSTYEYNETLQEIIKDYYRTWITERHTPIKNAWDAIREANMSSPYYELAIGNFTYAGRYLNQGEIEVIYTDTDGWTDGEEIASYMDEWRDASQKAYDNALENAEKSN